MNFKALDIIHLWADERNASVSIAGGNISVISPLDLRREAETVCAFLSLVCGQKWTFRPTKVEEGFQFTFFPVSVTPGLGDLFT